MLKLYGSERSRASIIQWYLDEFAIPYEFVQVDLAAGEHRQPEFLAINPVGKVPAIADGDFVLWESGAILLYLAEKHRHLPNSPEARAEILQWIFYGNTTLSTGILNEATRAEQLPRLLGPLEDRLTPRPYFMGESLSVVDVAVGSILAFLPIMFQVDYSPYPQIQAYLERLGERPAFRSAILKQKA